MTPLHQPLIAAEGLTRSFGSPRTGDRVEVLRGIDVTIPRGTMLAVVGPSGCGKTSLLYCLSGLDRPDGGRLRGFGADMASMPSSKLAELYRTRIGFVFQSSNLVESLTAEENVLLPDRLRGRRVDASRAASILAGLGVRERAGALPAKLSAGQRLRVSLARVLYQRPEVVFADEPTGALDSRSSRAVLEVLRGYPGADRSVVMVTHDIAAACMADVVLVMRDGLIRRRLTSPAPGDVLAAAEEAGRNA